MKISIDTLITHLEDEIYEGNQETVLLLILELKELVRTDPVAVKWITTPANLLHIHELLIETLGVPPKVMRVKNRVQHRQRRALLFVEAIEHGVRRVIND